ncbi:MAG: hypothetical protein A3G18_01670 [Rhodospirillales bacterium RIFCSPLOWO2_12_FULL_58_28]|nr:MAG: hypothetical protein A3H92_07850 [Rhodospirillales bacterium RIFCSPLOWO2_02_FULL_58_16]OHC79005.1 MAG: hypothetical protein A3G18_01670 [Rhodospirillales bacterium RIFCSPLOWO2_12_FULL_58_28]
MDILIISLAAFFASGLTLFSGFGLGTVLLPVFSAFFPVPVAVGATALVHLANNLFKLSLLGRHADPATVFRFGMPAVVSALAGAALLMSVSTLSPLFAYNLAGHGYEVTPVKLTVGALLLIFSVAELVPAFTSLVFDRRHMFLGGLLSGFFGGLVGLQGALRSAFLIKAGLDKEAFVATGVVIAVMVDISRLGIYGTTGLLDAAAVLPQAAAGCMAAFLGAFAGAKLLKKVTLRFLQIVVGVLLSVAGVVMMAGLI